MQCDIIPVQLQAFERRELVKLMRKVSLLCLAGSAAAAAGHIQPVQQRHQTLQQQPHQQQLRRQPPPPSRTAPRRPTLLQKLLAKDIRRDRSYLLQCFRRVSSCSVAVLRNLTCRLCNFYPAGLYTLYTPVEIQIRMPATCCF